MNKYTDNYNPHKTPQTEPIPGKNQVQNSAGGYAFQIDLWDKLNRFLILGSDKSTYYSSARALTRENGEVVMLCWKTNPVKTAETIKEISVTGRAPKQDPALFALALGTIHDDVKARQAAYSIVQSVCRTTTHLFQFRDMCFKLKQGHSTHWGRGMKRAVVKWYEDKPTDKLAFQMVKYPSRHGLTHKGMIEFGHKGAKNGDIARQTLYNWVKDKDFDYDLLPEIVQATIKAKQSDSVKELVDLIERYNLQREMLPNWAERDPDIWNTLVPKLGMTGLIRGLSAMTETGAIGPMNTQHVTSRLTDKDALVKARIHPFNVLKALVYYKKGQGKGRSWTPESKITDALDKAFYSSFGNVEKTGQRIMVAIDISGSMHWNYLQDGAMSCLEAAAAMSLITLAVEDNTTVTVFSAGSLMDSGIRHVDLSPKQRLDNVLLKLKRMPAGGTDCALPMIHAQQKKIPVDAFIIWTDNETWAGRNGHPSQALQEYRKAMNIPNAKLVVAAMTSTGFSIADPNDTGMLDIVGMDSAVPNLITNFIKGEIQ